MERILCVIDSLGSGGAQRQLVEIAINLKLQGYHVEFLVYHDEPFYKETLSMNNIAIQLINEKKYFYRLVKMRKFIRTSRFDVVISFLEASSFICEIAGLPFRRWRLIVGERSANPNIMKSFKLRLFRYFHCLADFVVANSSQNIEYVRKINPLIRRTKLKVIYNIVDLNRWEPAPNQLLPSNEKFVITIAASLFPLKNLKGLILALKCLTKSERENLEVRWFGKRSMKFQDYLDECLALIEENSLGGVIKILPETQSILKELQISNAIGLFSFYEGMPNIICEGMALGKPIIASSISDLPLLINDQCGILCDPHDPESICNAIRKLLKMNQTSLSSMGKAARCTAEKYFEKKIVLKQYQQLF